MAKKHDPENERIKRQYFIYLKEAKRQNGSSVDAAAKALNRFEVYTSYRSFKAFRIEQAVGFKTNLSKQTNFQTEKILSKATLNATLAHLKRFFQWLAGQPGYKSRLQYSDAEYFNLSEKDMRIATARREKPVPTLEQIKHAINSMPYNSEVEQRNRALIAFTLLTGARDSATASLKMKHVDLTTNSVFQDAREVRTKFSKTFRTFFFPVGEDIREIVESWVDFLRKEKLWSNDDPLFPSTRVEINESYRFEVIGLARKHWSTATPIRKVFREAFNAANLPYFYPHSFRNTLVQFGEKICQTPEEFKAWSQNLGHEKVLTTFYSYGDVPSQRQGEIIQNLTSPRQSATISSVEFAKVVARELRSSELQE